MKKIYVIIGIILFAQFTYSQEDDQLLVSEIKQSTVITQPSTLHKGFFDIMFSYDFSVVDKIFTDEGKKEPVMDNGWAKSTHYGLYLYYGITNRLEVSVSLPYVYTSMYYSSILDMPGMSTTTFNVDLKGQGIGDMDFGVNYQIIEGSRTKPSLVARLFCTVPTGEKDPTNIESDWKYDLPVGNGETTLALDLVYRKINYPYSYSIYGGIKYSFGGEKMMRSYEEPTEFKSGNFYNLGGSFNFNLNDWIAVRNDLFFGFWDETEYFDETDAYSEGTQYAVQYMPNINFQFKKFRFIEGVVIPVTGKSYGADPQYLITVQYIF